MFDKMMGERLKDARRNSGKTQEDISKILGISRAAYSHIENGRNEPDNETIVKLAGIYNVTTDFLLGNHQTPEWATTEDVLELDKMLDSNVNMSYGGENLTEEEKQRVKDILTGIFWEKLEKKKKVKN